MLMPEHSENRRNTIKLLGTAMGMAVLPQISIAKPAPKSAFTLCLNMSTIQGQKLGFVKELEVAAKAGFGSVEIWMNTLQDYLKEGGSLKEAKKIIDDLNIKV